MNLPTPQVKAAMEGGLGVHPDPEGDRLRDAVVEAADAILELDLNLDTHVPWAKQVRETICAAQALRDHRTKAAPELVPEPRCEPSAEDKDFRYHWCSYRNLEGVCVWSKGHDAWLMEDDELVSGVEFYRRGWRYLETVKYASPALPDKRVEPKPELLGDAQGCCDMGAACSCRGKPSLRAGCCFWTDAVSLQPATPNDSINSQLEQEKPPEPAPPIQREWSDKDIEIMDLAEEFFPHLRGEWADPATINFAHALLAKHSNVHPATPTVDNRIPVTLGAVRKIWREHFGGCLMSQRIDSERMAFVGDILAHFSNPITGEGGV